MRIKNMHILIIKKKVKPKELNDMLDTLQSYIKLAVDIKREILAGGGMLHADCEAALLEGGSKQGDIWRADWIPSTKEVKYETLINIRPKQGNRQMTIQGPEIRKKVEQIVKGKFT